MQMSPDEYYKLKTNYEKGVGESNYEEVLKNLANSKQNTRSLFQVCGQKADEWYFKRKKLHDKILKSYLDGYKAQKHPVLHIILGSIASGKTSVKDTLVENTDLRQSLFINFDEIKKCLSEYEILKRIEPKEAAQFVQSESAVLAGKLFRLAVKKKVIDNL